VVFKGAGLDSTLTDLYTIENCHPDRSGPILIFRAAFPRVGLRSGGSKATNSNVRGPLLFLCALRVLCGEFFLFYSLAPANLFALSRRNLAKNPFARAISFAICAFNSSGPANFFSSRNFFQNLTSILFGEKFPE